MEQSKIKGRTRSQESSNAIEKLYISMRHLFSRGFYKPMGISGEALRDSLLLLRPEIYGSIAEEKVELDGLIYVIERLPRGIEECRYINLTADEGYSKSLGRSWKLKFDVGNESHQLKLDKINADNKTATVSENDLKNSKKNPQEKESQRKM